MIKKFLEAMDDEREYDFIVENYSSMSKSELKSILLEYIFCVHNNCCDEVTNSVRDELELKEIFG